MASVTTPAVPDKAGARRLRDSVRQLAKDFQADIQALIEKRDSPRRARRRLTQRSRHMGKLSGEMLRLIAARSATTTRTPARARLTA